VNNKGQGVLTTVSILFIIVFIVASIVTGVFKIKDFVKEEMCKTDLEVAGSNYTYIYLTKNTYNCCYDYSILSKNKTSYALKHTCKGFTVGEDN